MNNDLISRSELKKELIDSCIDETMKVPLPFVLRKIDNVSTVETDIEVVAEDAYEQGYTDGWKERFGEPDGRPQGEWNILQKDDNGIHEIECPFCKYSKGGRFASVGVTFHKLPPFCESCGADMRPEVEK